MTKRTKTKRIFVVIGALLVSALVLLIIFWEKIMGTGDKVNSAKETEISKFQKLVKSQVGLQELTAPGESNPEIEKFFKHFGLNHESDATPWCAVTANYLLDVSGFERARKERGESVVRARSLETVPGDSFDLPSLVNLAGNKPIPYYTVVVGWREDPHSGKGHVGFYVRHSDTHIVIAGGNQSDKFTDNYSFPISRVTRVFNPVKKA